MHLPVGRAITTLQDIVVLLGLQIDGRAVSHPTHDWRATCGELFVLTPDGHSVGGVGLRLQ